MKIPEEILKIIENLQSAGFQAYLVGGCVRDLLMGLELRPLSESDITVGPKDWDIATNAKPEQIQKIFPDSVYENKFGTVAVKIPNTKYQKPTTKIVEITTFRLEGKYTDKRHPDEIKFAKTIEEDLARRDFTCNAIALQCDANIRMHANDTNKYKLIDLFGGQDDIKNKIIRTVGKPTERFNEDALRLMRAVRFAVQLDFSADGGPAAGWEIEKETAKAIKKESGLLEMIAKERIRDELEKILMTPRAAEGVQMLEDLNLLKYIMPELREGIGIGQNKHHIYTVWDHNLKSLDYAVRKNYSLEIRLAALLHDIAKPKTKAGEGSDSTFYNHEIVGAKMAARILDRLHFAKSFTEYVSHLVRCHLFYYNVGEVTASGVRRFLRRVGPENVDDLIKVREADRIGSGVPKARPYKIRHLLFMIEKVKKDPISPKMLKINGDEVMKILNIAPSPKIGWILSVLLEEVIENPEKNTEKDLRFRIKDLGKLNDTELEKMAKQAREKKEEFEGGIEEEMKKRYYVK